MPTQDDNKLLVSEPARVDFVQLLGGDLTQIVVLRRIQTLAGALIDYMNSVGTMYEREAYATLMRETAAEVAPNIHKALMDRTFDGQDALREAYTALVETYADVKGTARELNAMHALAMEGDAIGRRHRLAAEVGSVFGDVVTKALAAGTSATPTLTTGDPEEQTAEAVEVEDEGGGG